MMRLFGMSLKRRVPPPSFTQIGPSVKMNPSANFSILASDGTIALSAGSFSTTEPAEGDGAGGAAGCAGGGAGCEQNADARQEASKTPSTSRRFMKHSPLHGS